MGNVILQPDEKEYIQIRTDERHTNKNAFREFKGQNGYKLSQLGRRIDTSILYQFCNVENIETKVQELMQY